MTRRYLHAKPATEQAEILTAVFTVDRLELAVAE